jgi:endonuclease-8
LAEGDTILRAARRLERAVRGDRVEVEAPNPRGRATGVERLDGMTLEEVEPRGKHLLLHFGPLVLHSHMGMNGSWNVHRRGERWRKPRHAAWAVLRGERAEAVQFGGPTLRVLRSGALASDPTLSRLGPDILAPEMDTGLVVRSLRPAADRELGDALLDQTLVAGIGNIFKSEACFAARLSPWRPIAVLSDEELAAAVAAARGLMSSAADGRRSPFAVYRRAGSPCPRCGTRILARGQGDANRTTYWCPSCQSG